MSRRRCMGHYRTRWDYTHEIGPGETWRVSTQGLSPTRVTSTGRTLL